MGQWVFLISTDKFVYQTIMTFYILLNILYKIDIEHTLLQLLYVSAESYTSYAVGWRKGVTVEKQLTTSITC